MHAPTSLPNITICDPLMHAAKLSDLKVKDNDAFTLVGPGSYSEGELEDGADLFADIPVPVPPPQGKWVATHKRVREKGYSRALRKVLVEEVATKRLTILEATHCARGFLALQRSFLRRKSLGIEDYWKVSVVF